MARTEVFEDPEAKMIRGGSSAGSVRVRMRDGAEYHRLVTVPKGEPENMISRLEARTKFDSLVAAFISAEAADRLYDLILNLETAPGVAPYFDAATPTP